MIANPSDSHNTMNNIENPDNQDNLGKLDDLTCASPSSSGRHDGRHLRKLLHDERDEASCEDRMVLTSCEVESDDEKCSKKRNTLRFPQNKLFGREKELHQMEEIFHRLVKCEGDKAGRQNSNLEIVHLEGYSGAGKSALVEELARRLVKHNNKQKYQAFFASGKYDDPRSHCDPSSSAGFSAYSPSVPYSGIAQALIMLVSQLHEAGRSTKSNINTDIPPSILESQAEQDSDSEEDDDFFWGVDDCRLLPGDISLLVNIFPGLTPILQPTGTEPQKRSTSEMQDSIDCSFQTIVTSNKRRHVDESLSSSSSTILGGLPALEVRVFQIAMAVATLLRMILLKASNAKNAQQRSSVPAILIFFLDDLQWMDSASWELLGCLLKTPSLPPLMFLCASRIASSNSAVVSSRSVQDQLETILAGNNRHVLTKFVIRNLSPSKVRRFVAETLQKIDYHQDNCEGVPKEIEPLSQFIYSRTMGNILFCRQIIEALVRRKIIYYDDVSFEWKFHLLSLTSLDDHDFLLLHRESDFMQMVQEQMKCLKDSNLQLALSVASYIRHLIDPSILHQCLIQLLDDVSLSFSNISVSSAMRRLTEDTLREVLEHGVEEGVLLRDSVVGTFKFAHDCVQEAAYAMIPPGAERDKLRRCIGEVLLTLAQQHNGNMSQYGGMQQAPQYSEKNQADDWMLFCAVDHLNSLPMNQLPCDIMQFLRANFHVGCLCLCKGSFNKAILHFRIAANCIREASDIKSSSTWPSLWKDEYEFCVQVYTRLVETEFVVGNNSETERAIATLLERAKCPQDMVQAHCTRIQMLIIQNNNDRGVGAKEAVRLLRDYGQAIPENPTKTEIFKEKRRLKVGLRGRPISAIASLPYMQDDWQMKLLSQLVFISSMSTNAPLHHFACLRAINLALERGISKYLLVILATHGNNLRREGKFKDAYSYATVVRNLEKRFPEEKGSEHVTTRLILHSSILQLREPFLESMDPFLANYRMAMAAGNVEIALTSAMHIPLTYIASGLPINALLEPKLAWFQAKAQQLGQPGFVAIFQLCRQFLWRVAGKAAISNTSNVADSREVITSQSVLTEDKICEGLQGPSRDMVLRDSGILRLVLAYIFRDTVEMDAMIDRLDRFPLFDLPLVRQHLRLTFHGLAALSLGQQRRDKNLLAKGQTMMKELKKLVAKGSLNAEPAYLCLKAVKKGKKNAFDEAIAACSKRSSRHLEAIMNEQCALLLAATAVKARSRLEHERTLSLSQEYMENAYWLYLDWGVTTKAMQLRQQLDFSTHSNRENDSAGACPTSIIISSANQRFETLAGDPTEVTRKLGARGPPSMPVRSHDPPTIPKRHSARLFQQ